MVCLVHPESCRRIRLHRLDTGLDSVNHPVAAAVYWGLLTLVVLFLIYKGRTR